MESMGQETIKLISLNIEMAKHLDLTRAFLEKEKPDVVCMQEVYEQDLKAFGKNLGMNAVFGQMNLLGRDNRLEPPFTPYGIGMLSVLSIQRVHRAYYQGDEESAKEYVFNGNPQDDHYLLLYGNIKQGSSTFTVGTTHFMWTPHGNPDDFQRKDLQSLLAILQGIPEIVLCGDFNAPRGGEIFDTLAQHYKDNIPLEYHTSIDANLHRDASKIREKSLMVDGLFTTLAFRCSNVRLVGGVSDHLAIVAEVRRN